MLDHNDQIEFIAMLAYELSDYLDVDPPFIDWNELGQLTEKADIDYGKLKELIQEKFDAWVKDNS